MNRSLLGAALAATLALAGTAHAQSATYNIDPTHTFVTFEVSHFGTSTVRGRFDKKEGSIQFDRAAKTGKLDITIDMASISSGVAPFDKHLQSADFFNVAAHPTARFVADGLSFDGDKLARINGTLTLLGKTGPGGADGQPLQLLRQPLLQAPGLRRRLRNHDQAQPVGHGLRPAWHP